MNSPVFGVRRIAASSAILLAENVLRLVVTAAVSFWIAGSLGPALFGVLNFASALMAIFLGLAGLGLEVPSTLRLARRHALSQEDASHVIDDGGVALLSSAIALRLAGSLIAFVLLVAVAVVIKHDEPEALTVTVVVALAILGYGPSVFDHWFKAEVRAGPPATMRLLTTLSMSALKVACLALGLGIVALAATVALEAALGTALMWRAWQRANPRRLIGWRFVDPALAGSLLGESWPYLASTVALLVSMKIDVVILGSLASNTVTGVYSLVQKLSEVLYIVPVVVVDSVYPALARRQVSNPSALDGQLMFDLSSAVAFVAALVGIALAGPAIDLVFGDLYASALPIFRLHAWTCVAIALGTARARWLGMNGLQRHAPTLAIAGAVINVALNVVMIPKFGAWGAVVSALTSQFMAGFLTSFLIRDLRPIGVMQAKSLLPWGRLMRHAAQLRHAPA